MIVKAPLCILHFVTPCIILLSFSPKCGQWSCLLWSGTLISILSRRDYGYQCLGLYSISWAYQQLLPCNRLNQSRNTPPCTCCETGWHNVRAAVYRSIPLGNLLAASFPNILHALRSISSVHTAFYTESAPASYQLVRPCRTILPTSHRRKSTSSVVKCSRQPYLQSRWCF